MFLVKTMNVDNIEMKPTKRLTHEVAVTFCKYKNKKNAVKNALNVGRYVKIYVVKLSARAKT